MWYKLAHKQDFLSNLESLTSEFVEAAQKIYDDWDEHPDVYFGGGICHLIADAFVEIVYKHYPHYTASTFTRDDIQHVETIVYNIDSDSLNDDDDDVDVETDIETVMIDLSPYIYENGGGFSWTKIPDVEFDNNDITFYRTYTDRKYIGEEY
jgi:hypothetical protein